MDLKLLAAERAVEYLRGRKDVKVLGLGTGSTAERAIELIAELQRSGELSGFVGIPTSVRTERLARRLGLPLTTLEDHPEVDLTIDGADEVDPGLNLIKGLGGALTREKVVASASRELLIVADYTKRVERLGTRAPLPVEVLRFGWKTVVHKLEKLGAKPQLRLADERPFISDEGNYILDCHFPEGIADPYELDRALNGIAGVVEHGLFLGMADRVVVASPSGVEVLMR